MNFWLLMTFLLIIVIISGYFFFKKFDNKIVRHSTAALMAGVSMLAGGALVDDGGLHDTATLIKNTEQCGGEILCEAMFTINVTGEKQLQRNINMIFTLEDLKGNGLTRAWLNQIEYDTGTPTIINETIEECNFVNITTPNGTLSTQCELINVTREVETIVWGDKKLEPGLNYVRIWTDDKPRSDWVDWHILIKNVPVTVGGIDKQVDFDTHLTDGGAGWAPWGPTFGNNPYYFNLTVNPDRLPSTLSNIPIYYDLSNASTDFWTRTNNCADIRVTNNTGDEIAREIVYCDNTTNKGELWFLADNLVAGQNNTFTIYYGNYSLSDYARTDAYGANNVWSSYLSVNHFADATGTNARDDINVYNFTLSGTGGEWVPEETAYDLNDSDAFYRAAGATKYSFSARNNWVFEGYVKLKGADTDGYFNHMRGDYDGRNQLTSTALTLFTFHGGVDNFVWTKTVPQNRYVYVAYMINTTNKVIVLNNESNKKTYTSTPGAGGAFQNTIGDSYTLPGLALNGSIGLHTVRNGNFAEDYLLVRGANMGNQSDFFTYSEEGEPPVVNSPPVLAGLTNTSVVYNNTDHTWTVNVTDVDGNTSDVTFYFSVNGNPLSNQTFTGQANNSLVTAGLNQTQYFTWDNVSVIVQAYDGTDYATNATGSLNVTNRLPVATPYITPSSGTLGLNVNFTCYSTDEDDHQINTSWVVRKNGSIVDQGSTGFLANASNTTVYNLTSEASYEYNLTCTPNDSYQDGGQASTLTNVFTGLTASATLCPNVTILRWVSNVSAATINASGPYVTYSEANMSYTNRSLCDYTYLLNNSDAFSITYTASTNITTQGLHLLVNGTAINNSINYTATLGAGEVLKINVTGNASNINISGLSYLPTGITWNTVIA